MKKKMKKRKIIISLLCLLILGLGISGGLLCYFSLNKETPLKFYASNVGEIGYFAKTLGTTNRNIPTTTQNEGICERYPVYGTSLANITDEEKDNIMSEDSLLRVSSTTYDEIDENGNLLLNGELTGRKLYKHTASENMYFGNVSDDEQAVIEEITLTPKEYRNYVTGLYAPAGEVIKIEISSQDLEKIGGLTVSVGQISHVNRNNNIWKAKDNFCRMPNLGNIFTINKETSFVGNYLGGPIYIKPNNINVEFSVKISGAVKYPYFVYGLTTREEFEEMKNYSAPYFDYEVWDNGVRHSGPKSYANFDYDNLVSVGYLWENVCRTSRLVPNTSKSNMGICFIYDVFVAAGEACAFQGNNWVNAPCYWLPGALNYEAMTSTGFWGQIHEFNHHYQNYGIAPNIEVSNNATSLLSYVLYTNISSKRSESDSSLTGWNRYTDASRSLRETLQNAGSTQTSLNIYADILHSFGVDNFIKATKLQTGGYTKEAWFGALSKATNYDMSYYFDLIGQSVSDELVSSYRETNKDIFVPASMLYQTGRNYFINGEEFFTNTMKPYEVIKNQETILDFENYTFVPDDFTFEITNITMPKNGSLEKITDKQYKYTSDGSLESGEFYVTISLSSENISTRDITFSINLKTKDPKPTKTLYTYDTRKYEQTDDALNSNFEGYSSIATTYDTTTFMNHIANKQIGVVEGKIYIENDGDYNICLRAGRGNHALYVSFDGISYTKDIYFSGDLGGFDYNETHTKKYSLKKGQYLYYKQITISNGHSDAFTELGLSYEDAQIKTVPSNILYNVSAEGYKKYDFKGEPKFERKYLSFTNSTTSELVNEQIISSSFDSWDSTTKIENILDGNLDTFYHSGRNNFVSEDNPYELVLDLGSEQLLNKITFVGRKSGQLNLPCSFKLYGGLSEDNLKLIGEFNDLSVNNRKIIANFEAERFRFCKIVVTDTKSDGSNYNKYVCFSQINFENEFVGNQYNPTLLNYTKIGHKTFNQVTRPSTFGFIIEGNGKINYSFNGTQFGLILRQNMDSKIKIVIDNQEYIVTANASDKKDLAFLSNILEDGNHNIEIYVLSGTICIDSFVQK